MCVLRGTMEPRRQRGRVAVYNRYDGNFIRAIGEGHGATVGHFRFGTSFLCIYDDEYYICDSLNHRVQIFSRNGIYKRTFGEFGEEDGKLDHPTGIAISGGEIYLADGNNQRINVFDCEGTFLRQFLRPDSPRLQDPVGLTIVDGKLYVSDHLNSRILVFT